MASGPHRWARPRWKDCIWSATERHAHLHARRTHVRATDVSSLSKHAINEYVLNGYEASFVLMT
jgi:hypothetical protein